MPVISFVSPKGGAGKTTAALLLSTELAQKGGSVTVIDGDPRRWMTRWSQGGKMPASMRVVSKKPEEDIIDVIDAAKKVSNIVIMDLEGTDSMTVAYSISRSDFVIVPAQAGPMEGEAAVDAIKLVKQQERAFGVRIPYAVLMTRMKAAIRTKVEGRLIEQMRSASVPVFSTQLLERTAFREIIENQCCLGDLPSSTYKLDDAIANARSFAGEVISLFKRKQKSHEEAA